VKVKDLIKDQRVVTAPIDATLGEVAAMMRDADVSGVPVVDEWGALCGLVTATDVVKKASPSRAHELELPSDVGWSPTQHTHEHDPDWKGLSARECMVSDLVTIDLEDDVQEAARALINRMVHRAVVLGPDRNVRGILTTLDFTELVAEGKVALV
jgi:CBS domain-containing protein